MAASLDFIIGGAVATYSQTLTAVPFGAGVRVVYTISHSPPVAAANHPLTIGGVDAVAVASFNNFRIWVLPAGPAENLDVAYKSATWGGWSIVMCFDGLGFASETPIATAGEGLASTNDPHTMTNSITVNPGGAALLVASGPSNAVWSDNNGGIFLGHELGTNGTDYGAFQEVPGTYRPSWDYGSQNTSSALIAIWDGAGAGPAPKPRGYATIIG